MGDKREGGGDPPLHGRQAYESRHASLPYLVVIP